MKAAYSAGKLTSHSWKEGASACASNPGGGRGVLPRCVRGNGMGPLLLVLLRLFETVNGVDVPRSEKGIGSRQWGLGEDVPSGKLGEGKLCGGIFVDHTVWGNLRRCIPNPSGAGSADCV